MIMLRKVLIRVQKPSKSKISLRLKLALHMILHDFSNTSLMENRMNNITYTFILP